MDMARFHTVRRWPLLLSLIVMCVLIAPIPAFAASGDTPRQSFAGGGLLITLAIVYFSRKRAIGGWLLYFYIQLYLSFAISVVLIWNFFSNLDPRQWDNAFLYVMFFLSVVPVFVIEAVEAFVATKLLFRKNEKNVRVLRKTLSTLVAASAASLLIDVGFFRDPTLFFDVLTLLFAIIWALYFVKSSRVKSVFIENKWSYDVLPRKRRVLTVEDRRRLRKRALIAASVTFIGFLVLMGSVLRGEGKPPDMSIFGVPLFYALIAAVIAWYLPIHKKRIAPDKDSFAVEKNGT